MKNIFSLSVKPIWIVLIFCIQTSAQNVEVIGSLKLVDGTQGVGKILTSDSDGLATWNESAVPAPKTEVMVDNLSRTITTTWTLGPSFNAVSGFKAGSRVKVTYHIPGRNIQTSWGGLYIEPQISFDGGSTWNSLGSSGYDGGVMASGAQVIGSYHQTILVDPQLANDFSVTIRLYYKAYEGMAVINANHDINSLSGTASLMSGNNGLQHYTSVLVEEIF